MFVDYTRCVYRKIGVIVNEILLDKGSSTKTNDRYSLQIRPTIIIKLNNHSTQ